MVKGEDTEKRVAQFISDLGDFLLHCRGTGWTYSEIAAEAGVCVATVSRFANKHAKDARLTTAAKILKAAGRESALRLDALEKYRGQGERDAKREASNVVRFKRAA